MNKERRKVLKKSVDKLNEVISEIDSIYDDESESVDNFPENLQGSEKYDTLLENCETLSYALDDLNNAKETLEELL